MTEYASYIFCIPFVADAFNLLLNRSVIDTYIAFLVIIYAFAYILAWEAWSLIPWPKKESHFSENTVVCYWMHTLRTAHKEPQRLPLLGNLNASRLLPESVEEEKLHRSVIWWMNHSYRIGISSVFVKNSLIQQPISAFNLVCSEMTWKPFIFCISSLL